MQTQHTHPFTKVLHKCSGGIVASAIFVKFCLLGEEIVRCRVFRSFSHFCHGLRFWYPIHGASHNTEKDFSVGLTSPQGLRFATNHRRYLHKNKDSGEVDHKGNTQELMQSMVSMVLFIWDKALGHHYEAVIIGLKIVLHRLVAKTAPFQTLQWV